MYQRSDGMTIVECEEEYVCELFVLFFIIAIDS